MTRKTDPMDERIDLSTERRRSLWQRIADVALMDVNTIVEGGIDEASIAGLERVLLEADFGVDVTMELVEDLERAAERGRARTGEDLRRLLGERIAEILREADETTPKEAADAAPGAADQTASGAPSDAGEGEGFSLWSWARRRVGAAEETSGAAAPPDIERELRRGEEPPTLLLFVGVNGTGKTTTVAKMAHRLRAAGEEVLVAATDTFRAGAQDQLREWADRVGAGFVGGQQGADPAAVAFDAVDAARNRNAGWVLVDTAGRLHTQRDLMEELRKIDRVLGRKVEGAPQERLLVVDATSGQNVLAQAARFGEALDLTGLVLAKFDSTARAGTAVAVARELRIPVRYLGTGEGPDDLEPFDPEAYVEKVLA